jgi:large subunit ribosomal protein L19
MQNKILQIIEDGQKKTDVPDIQVGDTVDVHQRILEGQKERIQVFNGVVIAIKGRGLSHMITVRRIVQGEGVERVFPVHSPKIAKIEIKKTGKVRRAKLYYLRKRVGKATRLKERKGRAETTPPSGPTGNGAPKAAAKKTESAAATA